MQLLAFVRIDVLFLSASARFGNATKKGPVSRRKWDLKSAQLRARGLLGGDSSNRGDSPFHAERDLSIDVGSMLLVASRDVPDQRAGREVMPDNE